MHVDLEMILLTSLISFFCGWMIRGFTKERRGCSPLRTIGWIGREGDRLMRIDIDNRDHR